MYINEVFTRSNKMYAGEKIILFEKSSTFLDATYTIFINEKVENLKDLSFVCVENHGPPRNSFHVIRAHIYDERN